MSLVIRSSITLKCVDVYFPLRHVQVSNDDALEFYQKFGFTIVDTKEQYYKRIDPPHAFVLRKDLKGVVDSS